MKTVFSVEQCEQLAQALRIELQEYGGLLNFFKEQQQGIIHHNLEMLFQVNETILKQLELANELRAKREELGGFLAEQAGLLPGCAMVDSLPFTPQQFEPMLQALINEINTLLGSLSNKIRQNNVLVLRAQKIVEQVLDCIDTGAITQTYTPKGSMSQKKTCAGQCIKASA